MHELSVAMCILDLAGAEARRHEPGEVAAVHVRLGPLAGVDRGALEAAFNNARHASSLPSARLEIEEVPVSIKCEACGHEGPVNGVTHFVCTDCGSLSVRVVGGQELEISAMEIMT